MAQASYSSKRSWRTSCGKAQRFYAQALVGVTWVTQGSAANDAQLSALIARVQARKPGASIRVITGQGAVVDTTAALAAAA